MLNQETALDRIFRAIADPTRRAIVDRLAQGEASLTELAKPFDMSLPAVHQHLRRRTSHHTVVVRRQYNLPAEEVFRAWEDTAALEAWHTPGDASWTAEMLEHDFRVGGVKRFRFGPPGETFLEDCRYEDIVPDTRLCYA